MSLRQLHTAVIADDHAIIRSALASSLSGSDVASRHDIEVVAEAANGIEAIAAVRKHLPSLLILDVSMPHAGGTEVLIEARRWSPETKIVIFTGIESTGKIAELIEVGADGLFCKSDDLNYVTQALPNILDGTRMVSRRFTTMLEQNVDTGPLTDRERQILNLVVSGQTNKEIANILGISIKTVDRHRTSVMGKTASRSAVDMINYALREGLIDRTQT